MSKKFKLVKEAIRGDLGSSDQIGDYAKAGLSGAAFGAAAGGTAAALSGGALLPAVPIAAAGGAVWGLGSAAIDDAAYYFYGNPKKIAWQAGDLEDTIINEIVPILRSVKKESLASGLEQIAKEYKIYIDNYVRDGKKNPEIEQETQQLPVQYSTPSTAPESTYDQTSAAQQLINDLETSDPLTPKSITKFGKIVTSSAVSEWWDESKGELGSTGAAILPAGKVESLLEQNAQHNFIKGHLSGNYDVKAIAEYLKANRRIMNIDELAKNIVKKDFAGQKVPNAEIKQALLKTITEIKKTIVNNPDILDPQKSGLRADSSVIKEISNIRLNNSSDMIKNMLNFGINQENIATLRARGINLSEEELQNLASQTAGKSTQEVENSVAQLLKSNIGNVVKNPSFVSKLFKGVAGGIAGLVASSATEWTYDQVAELLRGGNLNKLKLAIKKCMEILDEIDKLSSTIPKSSQQSSYAIGQVMRKFINEMQSEINQVLKTQ